MDETAEMLKFYSETFRGRHDERRVVGQFDLGVEVKAWLDIAGILLGSGNHSLHRGSGSPQEAA